MQFFAHHGHDHGEIAGQMNQAPISYGGYLILAVGLMVLFIGVMLLISMKSRPSNRKDAAQSKSNK